MNHVVFTKRGHEDLLREFDELKASRPAAVLDLKKAREMGDLRENGWYKAARQKLSFLDRRLRELEYLKKQAKVVEQVTTDRVGIGSTVTISDGTVERTYQLVGGYESNSLEGKLSHNSPVGKALIGKKIGETAEVVSPSGSTKYIIIALQ